VVGRGEGAWADMIIEFSTIIKPGVDDRAGRDGFSSNMVDKPGPMSYHYSG